jgi:hypothetical protein
MTQLLFARKHGLTVNGLLQRNRLAAAGLVALFSFFLWIDTAGAALLKDIRVGEHKTFTRIVFELDKIVEARQILSEKAGRLTVIFADTYPDLVRKIPIKRVPNVDHLQIRSAKNQLSISLRFIHGHGKIASKFINHPPRLIVDVHFQTSPPASTSASHDARVATSTDGNDLQPLDASKGPNEAAPSRVDAVSVSAPGESLQPPPLILPSKELVHPETSAASSALSIEPPADKGGPPAPLPASEPNGQITDEQAQPAAADQPTAQPGRLQYFLVVALIIILLVMLILIGAIMLSLRRKWRDREDHLSTKEYLKRQNDRIAALNARIKEQLERYEEV